MSVNPTWLDIFYWIGMILIGFIVLYLLFIFFAWLGLAWDFYTGPRAKVTQEGIKIFSKQRGEFAFYQWNEIKTIITIFHPPGLYPQLILHNGEKVRLFFPNINELEKEIKKINVDIPIQHWENKLR